MSSPVLNLGAYRFAALGDLPALRQRLFASAAAAGIKGTVLLAEEGINLSVAGTESA
ncbi:MAG: sulfurtransferase, partial [Aquincola sp.]|nr:sulfurtransferase [Aquincola sp.]